MYHIAARMIVCTAVMPVMLVIQPGDFASAQPVAVRGGTIIDGTGRAPLLDGIILVENGRIAAVGAAGEVRIPESARIVDARGKYVMPGMIDANLHLFLNIDLETLIKYEDRLHEIVIEGAQIALKTGQTTVFDTWGPRAALVKARDMISSGQAAGSRIYLAGNIIGFDGPLSADFRGPAAAHVSRAFAQRINDTWVEGTGRNLLWLPPEDVRPVIRDYTQKGVDFLKYGASGHVDMNLISFSPRVQRAIVEEGHRAGMTVQAHTTSVESLDMAIDAGVDILTHCDISGPGREIPAETIRKMVERGIACSVLPVTQRHLDALAAHVPDGTLTPYFRVARVNLRNMIQAGAILLVSTDAGIRHPILGAESRTLAADTIDPRTDLGKSHFNAMIALEEIGMAPMEILKSVTSHVARAYKLDHEFGTLEAGKLADLVILNADPLASARNYRQIFMVLKEGVVVDVEALPDRPLISSRSGARDP